MNKIINYIKEQDFVSKLLIMLGIIQFVPLLMLIPYPQDYIYTWAFVIPGLFSITCGLLFRVKKPDENKMKFWGRNNESVIVVAIWLYAVLLGAMPFVISGHLTFVKALFETVSGWTTTGLSVMDVQSLPRIINFYRGFMQFCGGLGFVLLALIFAGGKNAMDLFSAEGHPDKLEPNIRSTAKIMMFIYLGFNLLGFVAYMIFGMPWFDSLFHSMAALSTGGFAMTTYSLADYNSLPIEVITIFLMIVGTTNFAILALLVKGKFKKFFRIGETRFFAVALIVMIVVVAFSGLFGLYTSFGESIRIAFFQIVSGLSTTGFSTIDFNTWKPNMLLIVIISMLIGGGAGSTAGGIKYTRVYAMYKSIIFGIKRKFMPERAVNEAAIYKPEGKIYLSNKYMEEIGRFIFVYMILYFLGIFLLTLAGVPLDKAMFEFASAIGTVGLSIGVTTPTTGNFILIVEMIGMLLGRLEIFIVFVSIISVFNKIFRKGKSL